MIPLIIRGVEEYIGKTGGFLSVHSLTVYLPTILLGSGQTEKEGDPGEDPPGHPAMVEDRDEE